MRADNFYVFKHYFEVFEYCMENQHENQHLHLCQESDFKCQNGLACIQPH